MGLSLIPARKQRQRILARKELEASFRTARAAKRKPVSKDENKYHLIDRSIIFCLVG